MLKDVLGATLPNEQFSTCAPVAPVIKHVPGPLYAGEILQFNPEAPGSPSFNDALLAVPAELLVIAIVNPIGFPAVTVAASGVLVTVTNPALAGGIATTTSLNTLVFPPMPASTFLFGS